jgi:hypothetical protein
MPYSRYKNKKPKYGFHFEEKFRLRNKKEREEIMEEVFNDYLFQEHMTKVSLMTDIDKEVVEKVVKWYVIRISHILGTVSNKFTRIISLPQYLKIIVKPGNRV